MTNRRYKVTATATYEVIADTPEDAEWRMRWLINNAALVYDLTVHEDEEQTA